MLVGTNLLATVPVSVALRLAPLLPIPRARATAAPSRTVARSWTWHKRHEADPGHAWLRSLFIARGAGGFRTRTRQENHLSRRAYRRTNSYGMSFLRTTAASREPPPEMRGAMLPASICSSRATGTGRLTRKPWISSQFRTRRNLACSSVSTAFGHHAQVQRMRQCDHGRDDGRSLAACASCRRRTSGRS